MSNIRFTAVITVSSIAMLLLVVPGVSCAQTPDQAGQALMSLVNGSFTQPMGSQNNINLAIKMEVLGVKRNLLRVRDTVYSETSPGKFDKESSFREFAVDLTKVAVNVRPGERGVFIECSGLPCIYEKYRKVGAKEYIIARTPDEAKQITHYLNILKGGPSAGELILGFGPAVLGMQVDEFAALSLARSGADPAGRACGYGNDFPCYYSYEDVAGEKGLVQYVFGRDKSLIYISITTPKKITDESKCLESMTQTAMIISKKYGQFDGAPSVEVVDDHQKTFDAVISQPGVSLGLHYNVFSDAVSSKWDVACVQQVQYRIDGYEGNRQALTPY